MFILVLWIAQGVNSLVVQGSMYIKAEQVGISQLYAIMKIETKYDIGQEVWFEYRQPTRGEIIAIIVHKESFVYHVYSIDLGNNNFMTAITENRIFRTKEELLNSL